MIVAPEEMYGRTPFSFHIFSYNSLCLPSGANELEKIKEKEILGPKNK